MGVIKTDFSLLKPASIGKGAFGAKTTELARFKDAFEKKGIVTPPHVSLSVDFFHNVLFRAGLVKEDGSYVFSAFTGHRILSKEEIKFNKRELTVLRAIFNRFQDYVVAIRSDERTAKGIGLYDTGFMLALNSSDKFNLFLDKIKTILLCQSDRSALAFVGRVGLPHGIGIQFMPLVAFHNTKNNSLFPLISIAGFTAKDSDKILFH
ncbi:MAG: hypothetical protein Q7S22_02695, partial [Candidatus Micrarchaeota archaeon]|nr:hypothetical protein [Candidatus Micrarchaeota archaeon]